MEIKTNLTPYEAQERILNGIIEGKEKYFVVSSSRQCGKSLIIEFLALKYAIEDRGSTTAVISPVHSQAKKIYLSLLKSLGELSSHLVASNNSQDLIINFKNGSTIHFFSAEANHSLRGFTLTYAFLDEFAYIRKGLWNEIVRPMLLILGKKACFFSTPNGKNNEFYELFKLGEDPDHPDWKSYTIKTEENPYIDPAEIETARKLLPSGIFAAEYLGEFSDSSSGVFEDIDKVSLLTKFPKGPEKGVKYYGGLDLAIQSDYSVLTIMDDKGKLIYWLRVNGTTWTEIIDEITQAIIYWGAKTYVELNNIGSVVYEELRKRVGSLVEPFTTTNKSKNDIIENLKLKITEGSISLPSKNSWPELHQELSMFSYKILPSGLLSYSGKISGGKDDIVMSLAFCTKMFTNNVGRPIFGVPSKKSFKR